MEIIVKKDYGELSQEAYRIFSEKLSASDVIGFATGSTPLGLYKIISEECRNGRISFAGKSSFNLDEYYPIDPSDAKSYRWYMEKNLFGSIDIDRSRINFPYTKDSEKSTVDSYTSLYNISGPIDLQILGIGANGHIAFNEPGSSKDSEIRIVELSESTVSRNGTASSQKAITMGIKEILEAHRIILLASGFDKAAAVKGMAYGDITPTIPASFLQRHGDVTVIVDSDAGALLQE